MSTLLLVGRMFIHSFTYLFILELIHSSSSELRSWGDHGNETVTNMQTFHLLSKTSEYMWVQRGLESLVHLLSSFLLCASVYVSAPLCLSLHISRLWAHLGEDPWPCPPLYPCNPASSLEHSRLPNKYLWMNGWMCALGQKADPCMCFNVFLCICVWVSVHILLYLCHFLYCI